MSVESVSHTTSQTSDAPSSDASCPLCRANGYLAYSGRDLLFDLPKTYDYFQCPRCAAVFQHPMPDADTIAGFYPDDYRLYKREDKLKRPSQLKKAVLRHRYGYHHLQVPAVFRLLAPLAGTLTYKDSVPYKADGHALDVGCANGRFVRTLQALGWRCEGVDFNQTAVEACRAQGLTVHHGDLESARLDDDSFDLITVQHVIEHLPDPDSLLGEASRILRPGGRLLIATPNSQALGRRWFGKFWFANDIPRHLILFSPSNLDALAADHGLKRRTGRLNTSPKLILNSLDYKIRNRDKPSRMKRPYRLLAKFYVLLAAILGRGDEIFAIYEKA
ncbi:MAG: class I SAM-dependent methyltransferase [Planctomycetota bacterium]